MELLKALLLPCLWSFIACVGFGLVFNIHGFGVLICGFGGALGWLAFLLVQRLVGGDVIPAFFAAVIIAIYSEMMARVRRCPVTGYLLVAFLPLVPGGGIYSTMEHALNGESSLFLSTGAHTLGVAGALAVGILMVSSLVRMYSALRRRRRSNL